MTPTLDPDVAALLEVMRAVGAPQPHTLPVAQAREQMRAALVTKGEPLPLHGVEDRSLPTPNGRLRVRLYRPAPGVLPAALFLHGGGWVLNDLDTHDRLCRRIAQRSGWMLVSLDYRRAPEHKHPAVLEDALLAYRWLLDNRGQLKASSLGVALIGESAGACTVGCLSLLLRDLGAPPPLLQMLAYPVTDMSGSWPSRERLSDAYGLDGEFLRWSFESYIPAGHDRCDPYLVPLAADDLSGLPPTTILTAEFDPLCDEGVAYARKLAAAGVEVEHIHADGQIHGFLLLDRAVPKAGALIDRLADVLAAHTPSSSVVEASTSAS